MRILRLLASGHSYYGISARYPQMMERELDKAIVEAVRWRNKTLIPARVAKGKTISQIAQEFGLCKQRIARILADRQRDRMLQEQWGGLRPRSVNAIRRCFRCSTLDGFKKLNLTDEYILKARDIGIKTLKDIRRVIPTPNPDAVQPWEQVHQQIMKRPHAVPPMRLFSHTGESAS